MMVLHSFQAFEFNHRVPGLYILRAKFLESTVYTVFYFLISYSFFSFLKSNICGFHPPTTAALPSDLTNFRLLCPVGSISPHHSRPPTVTWHLRSLLAWKPPFPQRLQHRILGQLWHGVWVCEFVEERCPIRQLHLHLSWEEVGN